MEDRKQDLAKARGLLKEAGYPSGIRVKGLVRRGWLNKEEMQLVQSQLKEVGIQVEIELVEFATHQNAMRDGAFAFAVTGGLAYHDPDLAYYQYFHTEKSPKKISNYPRYSNPRVDALLEQGRTQLDSQKRYRVYKEAVEILDEEAVHIPLGFAPYVFAFRTHVRDLDVYHNGQFFYGVGGVTMTWLDR
jgi:peptide/nickel transport system substrate-binding protein